MMIGTSTTEWVFICICILFLDSIAPVSVIYWFYQLLLTRFFRLPWLDRVPRPIQLWLAAEAAFATFLVAVKYTFRHSISCYPSLSTECRVQLFRHCHDKVIDLDEYLRRWLLVSDTKHIKRESVKDFLRWSFFGPASTEERKRHEDEIELYTTNIETWLGRKLPPGRTGVKGLWQVLIEARGSYRSLLWYTTVSIVDTITHCILLFNGFRFHRTALSHFFIVFPFRPLTLLAHNQSPSQHFSYWYRPHTSKTRLPVLFIHGIGIGLFPYISFLRDLNLELTAADGTVGIIALELLSVSSRLTRGALCRTGTVREIEAVIQHHGWKKFVLVTHSYGSVVAAHLLKTPWFAPRIGPAVFIDPVAFLLHWPQVTYNFLARPPKRANEHQLLYFATKDIGVAHTLARRFCWCDNILWKEELEAGAAGENRGRKVTVSLSGQDLLVDVNAVGRYLVGEDEETGHGNGNSSRIQESRMQAWKHKPWTGHGLELLWYEQLDHAQVFESEETLRPLVHVVVTYSKTG